MASFLAVLKGRTSIWIGVIILVAISSYLIGNSSGEKKYKHHQRFRLEFG